MHRCRLSVVVALSVAAATPLLAQTPALAPLTAQLPGGTRELSMANAGMGATNASVLFYNPAQVAEARGTDLAAQWYGASTLLTTLASTVSLGEGAIGIGVKLLGFSGPTAGLGSPDSLGANGATAMSGFEATLGYARELLGVRAGLNLKLMDQALAATHDRRGSVDVGLARDLWRGVLGVSAQNLGPALRYGATRAFQPTRVNVGYTSDILQAGPLDLDAATSVARVRGGDWTAALGGEVAWSWLEGYRVAARAGVRNPAAGEGAWTAGLGISADRLTLEVASDSRRHRPAAYRIGLTIR